MEENNKKSLWLLWNKQLAQSLFFIYARWNLPPTWCEPGEHQRHLRKAPLWIRNKQGENIFAPIFVTPGLRQEVHDFCSERFCWRIQISSSSFSSCLQSTSSFLFSSSGLALHIRPHTHAQTHTHMCTRLSYSHEITSSCRWWLIFCPRCNRIWQRGHETFGRTGCAGCHCAGPHSARGGTPC